MLAFIRGDEYTDVVLFLHQVFIINTSWEVVRWKTPAWNFRF